MDLDIYRVVNGWAGFGPVADLFKAISAAGPAVMVVAVALLFLVPRGRGLAQRRLGAVTATVAAALALTINQPLAHAIDRARPYVTHPHQAHLLVAASPDPSFPSDHATGAFALALGVWAYDRRWGGALLVGAVLLSVARVVVGTHYPSDVVAGALIAAIVVALLALTGLRRPLRRFAEVCAALWDGLLGRIGLARRPSAT